MTCCEFERVVPCPAGIYWFKVNHANTRTMCETCSNLTTKTPERRQEHREVTYESLQ